MGRVRVITQGKIWANRTSREVLWSILRYKKVSFGVVRIASTKPPLEGEMSVCNGIFVSGARIMNKPQRGYDAIRMLLSIEEGTFQYLDYAESDIQGLDQNLKIRLAQLINKLPNLPETLNELVGANTINRIRAIDVNTIPSEEHLIDKDTFKQLADWDKRNMHLRAAAMWGTFVVVACVAALLYFFQK